jgi:hypothetical protein
MVRCKLCQELHALKDSWRLAQKNVFKKITKDQVGRIERS